MIIYCTYKEYTYFQVLCNTLLKCFIKVYLNPTPSEVADPDHHRGVRLPPLAAPAAGADDQIVRRPAEAKPPGNSPRYPRGSRLPPLAAPDDGSNDRTILRPAEAKPPGHSLRYPRGSRLPRLVAPAAGANERIVLRPAENKLPDYKPPGEKVVYFSVLQL